MLYKYLYDCTQYMMSVLFYFIFYYLGWGGRVVGLQNLLVCMYIKGHAIKAAP